MKKSGKITDSFQSAATEKTEKDTGPAAPGPMTEYGLQFLFPRYTVTDRQNLN
jgi:hypothetical protein